ncbi:hypothetical protein ACFLZP_01730 [Patescibacteria group bacterium]
MACKELFIYGGNLSEDRRSLQWPDLNRIAGVVICSNGYGRSVEVASRLSERYGVCFARISGGFSRLREEPEDALKRLVRQIAQTRRLIPVVDWQERNHYGALMPLLREVMRNAGGRLYPTLDWEHHTPQPNLSEVYRRFDIEFWERGEGQLVKCS